MKGPIGILSVDGVPWNRLTPETRAIIRLEYNNLNMKPGEDKRFVELKAENFSSFFQGMLSTLIKSEEDLKRPVGELMIEWMSVRAEDKDTPYHTRTGTLQDLHCNTHYRKLTSIVVDLKDQKGIR